MVWYRFLWKIGRSHIKPGTSWYVRSLHTSVLLSGDFYKVLRVNHNATQKEIKSAYFALAKKYHPDSNPDDAKAAKHFQKVSEAYETLGNPQKRQAYDTFGQSSHGAGSYQQARNYGNPFGNQQWSYQATGMNAKDAEQMFKKILEEFGAKGQFKTVNFGGTGFPKSGGGVFNSIFNNMMQGFGAKLAEEMMKSQSRDSTNNTKNQDSFEEMVIEKGPHGYHFVKKKKK